MYEEGSGDLDLFWANSGAVLKKSIDTSHMSLVFFSGMAFSVTFLIVCM